MSAFDDILQIKNSDFVYTLESRGNISLNKKRVPLSIRKYEFDQITENIVKYNLKRGYECATAFGVSAMAAGHGFKQTGGKLVTMDAFVEEYMNSDSAYRNITDPVRFEESTNRKSARFLIEHFGLQDVVFSEIGWSPIDVASVLSKHYKEDEKLDFVFIDAGHFPHQVLLDIQAIVPFLAEKNVLMFHDVYPFVFDHNVNDYLYGKFGKKIEILATPESGLGDNLGIMVNL